MNHYFRTGGTETKLTNTGDIELSLERRPVSWEWQEVNRACLSPADLAYIRGSNSVSTRRLMGSLTTGWLLPLEEASRELPSRLPNIFLRASAVHCIPGVVLCVESEKHPTVTLRGGWNLGKYCCSESQKEELGVEEKQGQCRPWWPWSHCRMYLCPGSHAGPGCQTRRDYSALSGHSDTMYPDSSYRLRVTHYQLFFKN